MWAHSTADSDSGSPAVEAELRTGATLRAHVGEAFQTRFQSVQRRASHWDERLQMMQEAEQQRAEVTV